MRRFVILLSILFSFHWISFSQSIKEKLIFTDNQDSSLINAWGGHSFDRDGNYCFEYRLGEKQYYAKTSKKTIGPFKSTSSAFSGKGNVTFLYNSYNAEREFYYKNTTGTQFYGPVTGKVERQITENSRGRVALTVSKKDSIFYYLDDRLLGKRLRAKNDIVEIDDWCTFSENGHSLYYVPKDSVNILYLDDRPIDTSIHRFYELHIVNSGDYVYAKGEKPKTNSKSAFQFFIHTKDTVIGPVRTVWKHFLNDDGGYYYTGDDEGPDYIAANHTLHRNVENVGNILLPNAKSFGFTFSEGVYNKVNVNGKIYTYDYKTIYHPTMDSGGNFAMFGLKDYYLYKYINGKQQDKPVSRYGVRGVPLYINAKGSSVHYFKTDDSVYIYRDDELLLPPIAREQNFKTADWDEMISAYPPREKPGGKNQLSYFEFDSTGYFLFNGILSRPMFNVKNAAISDQEVGRIITGELNDKGFFVLQKTGEKAFTLNINNQYYTTLNGIDQIDNEDYFFDGRELVIYARKGLSYYQYTISL